MKDIFDISLLIIKKKLKVLSGDEKLRLKLFNEQYEFSRSVDFKKVLQKITDYSVIDKEKAWKAVLEKTDKKTKASVIFISRAWYKYIAAASAVLLLSISYFVFNNREIPEEKSVTINPVISVGNSKATLTLEDGSNIILEKGKNYKNSSVQSNGEHIIYDAENKKQTSQIGSNYLTVPRGGQFFIELADGTKVWLNSESQLKYPVAFNDGELRKVELVYGEAYFDVSPSTAHKGSKFEVLAKKQIVQVIGTQFNIKAYNDETNIYTTLVEGKVAVNISGKKEILVPNEQSDLDLTNNSIKIYKVDLYSSVAWKEGFFSFRTMPLKDIVKVLSRWYDVDIVIADKKLENVNFNGVLKKNQDIREILTTIQTTKSINSYEIKNKKIIIK